MTGLPEESVPQGASRSSGGSAFTVFLYGLTKWSKLFTPRQLLALGTFVKHTRALRDAMKAESYADVWVEAVSAYLSLGLDRLADYSSAICSWHNSGEKMRNTFGRFALPILWDFTEVNPCSEKSGGYFGSIEWIAQFVSHTLNFTSQTYSQTRTPSPREKAETAGGRGNQAEESKK